jgi:hypothetical protein
MEMFFNLAVSTLAGALAGGLSAWLTRDHLRGTEAAEPTDPPQSDPELDDLIDRTSSTMFDGDPEAAHLLARKVRLVIGLRDRHRVRPS